MRPDSIEEQTEVDGMDDFRYPWQRPPGSGVIGTIFWIIFFPVHLLLFLTIPDVRMGPKCAKLYPISFIMSMVWIGAFSYLATWMIRYHNLQISTAVNNVFVGSVIGYTWKIPDSVMGLTFLAVGTSIPEVISSLIVSKQGQGSMAVSNSIGSNTFDILICLGLPWLIQSILQGSTSDDPWAIQVNSEGLTYTVINLMVSLLLLYLILLASRFTLSMPNSERPSKRVD